MKKIILLVMLATLSSCKKPSCDLTEKYTDTAAERIGGFLACENKAAIALDLQSTIEKLNMCEKSVESGMIAATVCKPASKFVANLVIEKGIPSKWECKGGSGVLLLESALYKACSQLPF